MSDIAINNIDNFRIDRPDGLVAARVSFLATLYYCDPDEPAQRARVGMATEQFLQRFGGAMQWAKAARGSGAVAVQGLAPAGISHQFGSIAPYDDLSFYAHSGEQARDAGLVMIDVFAPNGAPFPQLGHISVSVGIEMLSQIGPDAARGIVCELSEAVQPFHGYAGLGLVRCPNPYPAREAEPFILGVARQFPGVIIDMPLTYAQQLEDGILGVNWQTVLGPEMVGRLGGRDALLAAAKTSGLEAAELGNAIVIQAGASPELGGPDGAVPEAYRRANALLRKVRSPYKDVIMASDFEGFDRRAFTEAWLSRFD